MKSETNTPRSLLIWQMCCLLGGKARTGSIGLTQSGFTLIELIVVFVVTGILAALSLPNFLSQVQKACYAEAKSQLASVRDELYIYNLENGYFPADVNRNQRPNGINFFPLVQNGNTPCGSTFDYESWDAPNNSCYIQLTYMGTNSRRDTPQNTVVEQNPGFYTYTSHDDLIVSLGVHGKPCRQ
ncbi:prepilin-type N-terminal cleavage/methylation domain protein [Rubidibacter lacunae KORDI 51-2]|uniref:Prepilin-type N-terminal cleavage/methylation domain protein n=1 Tax=Rubidibacter lacunae KORDI 51-2 TaxID=582515 RepID=U5D7N1_9CHRO|nr:prepilin-type N-terminal cleavage/methylation domain protein [Rubidibacter lacunae KORDI 51-2]